jgi:hypothetical protein
MQKINPYHSVVFPFELHNDDNRDGAREVVHVGDIVNDEGAVNDDNLFSIIHTWTVLKMKCHVTRHLLQETVSPA